MPETNDLRLFEEGRLHPWKPDNKVLIDAHLAMLGVTDPQKAAGLAALYAKKLEDHMAGLPKAAAVIEAKPDEPVVTATFKDEPVAPAKRKYTKKH